MFTHVSHNKHTIDTIWRYVTFCVPLDINFNKCEYIVEVMKFLTHLLDITLKMADEHTGVRLFLWGSSWSSWRPRWSATSLFFWSRTAEPHKGPPVPRPLLVHCPLTLLDPPLSSSRVTTYRSTIRWICWFGFHIQGMCVLVRYGKTREFSYFYKSK